MTTTQGHPMAIPIRSKGKYQSNGNSSPMEIPFQWKFQSNGNSSPMGNSKPVCSPKAQNKLMEEGINLTVRHTFIHMDLYPSKSLRRCSSDPTVPGNLGGIEPLPTRQQSQPNPVQPRIRAGSKASTGICDSELDNLSEGSQDCDSLEKLTEGSQECDSLEKLSEGSQDQIEQQFPSIGSMQHYGDDCRACAYFYKKKCLHGYECLYCHLPHEIAKRPGKNTRRRTRRRNSRELEDAAELVDNEGGIFASSCPLSRQLTEGERWSDVV